MNRFHFMLLCVLVAAAMLTYALLNPEPANGHGVSHARFAAMRQGGSAARHEGMLVAGWCYGTAQLVFFALCLPLGLKRDDQATSSPRRWFLAVTLAYVVTFTMVLICYALGMDEPLLSPFWDIPWATCWSVFGMWIVPLLYTVLYLWRFPDWVFTSEDQQRFQEIKRRFGRDACDG